jgi:hypothetical protein
MAGKKKLWLFLSLTALSIIPAASVFAQISTGGIPGSFTWSIPPGTEEVITVLPPASQLTAETAGKPAEPYRYAINLPVDIGIGNNGTWTTTPDGSRIWRVTIHSAGARALTLYFDDFALDGNGKVFVYNPSRTRLLGAFTAANNHASGAFATELMPGDQLTLEYDQPAGEHTLPGLHVSELSYAYRGVPDPGKITDDFGNAGKCEVNMNCEEGNDWQTEKKGVARISVKLGLASYWCSGSLVNNVRNDHKPYFLTAYHCGMGTTPADRNKWIFYFDYESSGCPNPAVEPFSRTTTGATLLATSGVGDYLGSDFYFLMFNSNIPSSWDVFFNGWSRQESPPAPGKGIHHPEGDIKKISTYTGVLEPATWGGGPSLGHWVVNWIATPNGHGVTEGGSSGSPIFDSGGHIVGTLTGGDSSCDSLNGADYYGRFSYHWDKNGSDSTRALKFWLDPDNTNTMILNGTTLSVNEPGGATAITVAPNPFTDRISVRLPALKGKVTFVISDLAGHKVLDQILTADGTGTYTLTTKDLAPGIYFLRVKGENFSRVVKLIRQR